MFSTSHGCLTRLLYHGSVPTLQGEAIRLEPVRSLEAMKMVSPTLTSGDPVGLTAYGLV